MSSTDTVTLVQVDATNYVQLVGFHDTRTGAGTKHDDATFTVTIRRADTGAVLTNNATVPGADDGTGSYYATLTKLVAPFADGVDYAATFTGVWEHPTDGTLDYSRTIALRGSVAA